MKIERKDIGVKEVPEGMKNGAIARKKAFAKKTKKKFSRNKLYALTYDEKTDTLTGKEAPVPKGMERIKCPKCFGKSPECSQGGCHGTGFIVRLKAKKKTAREKFRTGDQFSDKEIAAMKKTASKVKKVVAKVTKPVTIKAKIVAKVKKVITKGNKHGKKDRSKGL